MAAPSAPVGNVTPPPPPGHEHASAAVAVLAATVQPLTPSGPDHAHLPTPLNTNVIPLIH